MNPRVILSVLAIALSVSYCTRSMRHGSDGGRVFSSREWADIEARRALWIASVLGKPTGTVVVFAPEDIPGNGASRHTQFFAKTLRARGWQVEIRPVMEKEGALGIPMLMLSESELREQLEKRPVAVISLIGAAPFAPHYRTLARDGSPPLIIAEERTGAGDEARAGVREGWIAAAIVPRAVPIPGSADGAEWLERQFELIRR